MTTAESARAALNIAGWEIPGSFDPTTSVWYTDREVTNSFPEAGVDVFHGVDDDSFWFDHRNAMIEKLIAQHGAPGAFLEVGSGSGVVAAHLASSGIAVGCVEPIERGAIQAAARGVSPSLCGDLASLQLPDDSVPNIGMFDVIEHLDEPQEILRESLRVLQPTGALFITVPAHQWLWSEFDDWNGHVRRYTTTSLRTEIETAGFTVTQATYFFLPLLAPAAISRVVLGRLRKKRSHQEIEADLADELAPRSSVVDRVVRAMHAPEVALLGRTKLPSGTSIILAATPTTKRDGHHG